MSAKARPSRHEQREQRRAEERARREAEVRQARVRRYAIFGVIAVLVVIAGVIGIPPLLNATSAAKAQGTQYPDQGRTHVAAGSQHDPYNSNPPTSGPHWDNWVRQGVYTSPQPDEMLVHTLEHGGIVIEYNCPDGCPDLVKQLTDFVNANQPKLVLAPRPNKDVPYRITLAAWTWLDGFNDFDADRIRAFIRAHRDQPPAPEIGAAT